MSIQKTQTSTFYFTVATAGHVAHGKTSLLKALTGIDPDRLKEEKERGMTTDLGFAHLNVSPDTLRKFAKQDSSQQAQPQGPNELAVWMQSKQSNQDAEFKIGFIDVPGHGKFPKNMLAGV